MEDEGRLHTRTALHEALNCLNDHQREIVVLFHQQGWPISQIASHKDMPEGTVKSHLHRARQRMRRLLEQTESHRFVVEEATR
jgi:RNA polymerase sigma-70 factor (ECF subfamily)